MSDRLFENAQQLTLPEIPLESSESLQPDPISTLGELKERSEPPAQGRFSDSQIALIEEPEATAPGTGPPDDPLTAVVPVYISQVGGFEGDVDSPCTFTYEMSDLFGNILENSVLFPVSPARPRPQFGRIVPAAAGGLSSEKALGIAIIETDASITLYDAGEVPGVAACP